MTTQHLTAPACNVNPSGQPADVRAEADPNAVCALPWCERSIGSHPPVGVDGAPDGPVHVDGVVYGNARCAYQAQLNEQGRLCGTCGGDNTRCSHTRSARAWSTRFTRTVPFPLRSVRP